MNNPYGGAPQYGPGPGQPPFGGHPQQGGQPYGAPPQYGPPQGGYGQQPPPANYQQPSQPYAQPAQPPRHQPGPPGIALDTSYFPLMFILALFGPKIEVNGQALPNAKWGYTHIPVPPGQYQVRVSTRYLWTFGGAETVVHLAPGESAPVFYKAPAIAAFVDGAIGPVPQKTPGLVALLIISVLPILLCFLGMLVSLAAV